MTTRGYFLFLLIATILAFVASMRGWGITSAPLDPRSLRQGSIHSFGSHSHFTGGGK